jgi:hypothetical protein
MAAETLVFADAFASAFILEHDLQRTLGREIPLLMLTDSKFLFDLITRYRCTTEKRLMTDIAAIREAYNDRIISNIGLFCSDHNLADAMTKIGHNMALQTILRIHCIPHPIEQYIVDSRFVFRRPFIILWVHTSP